MNTNTTWFTSEPLREWETYRRCPACSQDAWITIAEYAPAYGEGTIVAETCQSCHATVATRRGETEPAR